MDNKEENREDSNKNNHLISQDASENGKTNGESQSKDNEESISVGEIVKDMPPSVKRVFEGMFMSSRSGYHNPIYEKINEAHIEKIIDYSREDEKDNYNLKSSNRYFHVFYTVLALGFIVFLIVFLMPLNVQLLTDILKIIVIFAAGVGSGFGLKSHLDKKNSS